MLGVNWCVVDELDVCRGVWFDSVVVEYGDVGYY